MIRNPWWSVQKTTPGAEPSGNMISDERVLSVPLAEWDKLKSQAEIVLQENQILADQKVSVVLSQGTNSESKVHFFTSKNRGVSYIRACHCRDPKFSYQFDFAVAFPRQDVSDSHWTQNTMYTFIFLQKF